MRRPTTARPLLAWLLAVAASAAMTATAETATAVTATGSPASAAGYDGYCRDASGTTVVVDLQQLGGGVVVRCAASLPSGATGLDALRAAGVPYEGVRRYGDAFICRLYGKPSASVALPVQGNPGYREQCIDTPPAAAYWSYWSASNGGRWIYSQYGVRNRSALRGGFEGWSFALNATSATLPPPRLRPTRPAGAAPKPSPTSPPSTAPPSAAPPSSAPHRRPPSSTGAGAGTRGPAVAPASDPAARGSRTDPPRGDTTSRGSPAAALAASSASSAGRSTPATQPSTPGGSSDTSMVAAAARLTPTEGPADSPATLIGAGMFSFLVVAGIGTAWRRRRTP